MALTNDITQAIPTVEDTSNNEGKPLALAVEGQTITGKNASAAFAAKDSADQFKYLEVDGSGQLKVVVGGGATTAKLSDSGNVTGGTTEQTVLTITLQNSLEYCDLSWVVSNFRETEYRVIWVDDVGGTDTETELMTVLCNPSDPTDSGRLSEFSFTTGATGTQELRVVGTNKSVASQMRASISILEIQ
jgi:hypothetical protein